MKSVFFESHGGPDVLRYGDWPDPVAGAEEVVIDIHAASINGADWKVRAGLIGKVTMPHVLGRDFSGVVSSKGAAVDDLEEGDRVFGVCDVGQEGSYAEKLSIPSRLVAKKPAGLTHGQTAALALTGLTAIVAIEETLRLRPNEQILIQGGAGGVGGFAIQLAKHIGARVITTSSAENLSYVRSLGADEAINYRADDFTKLVSGIDAVFDTVGGEVGRRSFSVLRPGGRAAFIAYGPQIPPAPRPDLMSLRPDVRRDRKYLQRIVELVSAGAVRAPEIISFPLQDAAKAHATSESRHLRGKLVLLVR